MLLVEIVAANVLRHLGDLRAPHVFADGDELHLRCDDALPRIPKLRDRMPGIRAERTAALAAQSGEFHEPVLLRLARILGVLAGEVAVVLRLHLAAVVFRHVLAIRDPFRAQCRQALVGRAGERRIAPRPGAVIDAHGLIRLQFAAEYLRRRERDLAHRHAEIGMNATVQIHAGAGGKLGAAVRLDGVFRGNHGKVES